MEGGRLGKGERYLILNLKGYADSFSEASLRLAGYAREAAIETGANVIVCPPEPWIQMVSDAGAVTFAQHADPYGAGATTGFSSLSMLRAAGATGLLINHSEHQLRLSEIEFLVEGARREGMVSVLCADTVRTVVAASVLQPDMVAIEPPELIGKGISVSKARPEVITDSVRAIRKVSGDVVIIAGAGISTPEDVRRAVELGAEGALVASAVVKSERQRELVVAMAEALQR